MEQRGRKDKKYNSHRSGGRKNNNGTIDKVKKQRADGREKCMKCTWIRQEIKIKIIMTQRQRHKFSSKFIIFPTP